MKLADLQHKLIAAARAVPADERVPYAFEKRVMARLSTQAPPDGWILWGHALTRAAVFCLALMTFLIVGAAFLPSSHSTTLSQDLEQTLLAAVENNPEPIGEAR